MGSYTYFRQNRPKKRLCNGNLCLLLMKRSIQQEDRPFVNTYASNIGVPKYIKQILTDVQEEIDTNDSRGL